MLQIKIKPYVIQLVNTRLGRSKYGNNITTLLHNGEHITDNTIAIYLMEML